MQSRSPHVTHDRSGAVCTGTRSPRGEPPSTGRYRLSNRLRCQCPSARHQRSLVALILEAGGSALCSLDVLGVVQLALLPRDLMCIGRSSSSFRGFLIEVTFACSHSWKLPLLLRKASLLPHLVTE